MVGRTTLDLFNADPGAGDDAQAKYYFQVIKEKAGVLTDAAVLQEQLPKLLASVKPTITSLVIGSSLPDTTIFSIEEFNTDIPVTEYLYQVDPAPGTPDINDPGWSSIKPTNFDIQLFGSHSIVVYVKSFGAVSDPITFSVTSTGTPNKFNAIIGTNTTVVDINVPFGYGYTRWFIGDNNSTAPTLATDGSAGTIPKIYDLGDYLLHLLYSWLYTSTGWVQWLPSQSDGAAVPGLQIQAIATAPVVFDAPFAIGSNTATTASATVSGASTIDSLTINIDIVDTYDQNRIYNSTVSAGAVTITGLSPSTTYGFAELAYPQSLGSTSSRASLSNVVEVTTDATGSLSFSLTSPTDTLNVPIATFVITDPSGLVDRWYWNFTGVAPDINSSWAALPIVGDTVTWPGYTLATMYVWLSVSTDLASISVVSTATATPVDTGAAAAVFSMSEPTIILSEEGQPVRTITVLRGNKLTGTDTIDVNTADGVVGNVALADKHYKSISTTLTFAPTETSKTVDLQILYTNIGHSGPPKTKNLTVNLSNNSAGSITGPSTTITIAGLHKIVNGVRVGGYHTNGQIDVNNPPINMPKISGTSALSGSAKVEYKYYDAQALVDYNVTLADGTADKVIKDCVFVGANKSSIKGIGNQARNKLINCAFLDWNQLIQLGSVDNRVYTCNAAGAGFKVEKIEILGCKGVAPGSFSMFWYPSGGNRVCWNYFKNTINLISGLPQEGFSPSTGYNDGALVMFWDGFLFGADVGQEVRGNVSWTPGGALREGTALDMYNYGLRAGTSELSRSRTEMNWAIGSGGNRTTLNGASGFFSSAFGYQVDGFAGGNGYIAQQFNYASRNGNGGLNGGDATNVLTRYNEAFTPNSTDGAATENGIGIGANNPDGTNVVQYNKVMWYQSDGLTGTHRSDYFQWDTTSPVGWTANRIDATDFDNGGGEILFDQRHIILNNAGWGDGIHTAFAQYNTPAGNGILRFDGVANQLSFAAYGEAFGTTVNIAAASGRTGAGNWDSWYDIPSGTSLGIRVVVDPTTLLAIPGDKFYNVKVTSALITDYAVSPYDQSIGFTATDAFIGEWAGTEEVSGAAAGTTPAVPAGLAVGTVTVSTVPLTWTSTGAASYRVYRDGVLIASPLTSAYTDTGLTAGTTYSYSVASASGDVPALLSAQSQPVSGTPIDSTALILMGDFGTDAVDNAAFDAAYGASGWIRHNVDVIVSGGIVTMTNNTAAAGALYYSKNAILTAGGAVQYALEISVTGGDTSCFIDLDSTSNGLWGTGDILRNQSVDSISSPKTLATNNPTTTDLRCTFWINSASLGAFVSLDYTRLNVV